MTQDNSQAKTKAPAKNAHRRARKLALQGLYQWLLSHNDPGMVEAYLQDARGFNRVDRTHLNALLHGTIHEETTLTKTFTPYLDRPAAELSPVECATLPVGVYELVHCVDIPYKVIINEMVELTKTFGGVKGYKYVNGVLGKLAAQVHVVKVAARR